MTFSRGPWPRTAGSWRQGGAFCRDTPISPAGAECDHLCAQEEMPRGHSLPGPLSQAQEFTSLPAPCCQGVRPGLPSALQPPVLRGQPWGALQGSSSYLGGCRGLFSGPHPPSASQPCPQPAPRAAHDPQKQPGRPHRGNHTPDGTEGPADKGDHRPLTRVRVRVHV